MSWSRGELSCEATSKLSNQELQKLNQQLFYNPDAGPAGYTITEKWNRWRGREKSRAGSRAGVVGTGQEWEPNGAKFSISPHTPSHLQLSKSHTRGSSQKWKSWVPSYPLSGSPAPPAWAPPPHLTLPSVEPTTSSLLPMSTWWPGQALASKLSPLVAPQSPPSV